MKNINILSNGKVKNDKKILLISDLHIKNNYVYKKLLRIVKKISKYKLDYILILGDICDKTNTKKEILYMINDILNKLSNIAPTYTVLGNHDLLRIDTEDINKGVDKNYLEILDSISNFKVVKDEIITLDSSISLIGVNLPYSYYTDEKEKKDKLLKILNNKVDNGLLNNYNENNLNIFMIHSPNNIFDKNYLEIIDFINNKIQKNINFDIVLAGHLHKYTKPFKMYNTDFIIVPSLNTFCIKKLKRKIKRLIVPRMFLLDIKS